MPAEEPRRPVLPVYVLYGDGDAEPGARILEKLGIVGLEEDFDSVERRDNGFGLRWASAEQLWSEAGM